MSSAECPLCGSRLEPARESWTPEAIVQLWEQGAYA